MTLDDLEVALRHPYVQALLRVIRNGESNQTDSAYTLLYGGSHFTGFADHPRIRFYEKEDEFIRNGKKDYTTCAGAYQITETTWNGLQAVYHFPDFSPHSQDLAAVALLFEKHAIEPIQAGNLQEAIDLCHETWVSLPGSSSVQPQVKMAKAKAVWDEYIKEKPVVPAIPIILSLLPTLLEKLDLPKLSELFKPGVPVSERNTQIGIKLFDIAKDTLGAVNEQQVIQKLEADPTAIVPIKAKVQEQWYDIVVREGGGGGIEGARDFLMAAGRDNPVVWQIIKVVTYAALGFLVLANILAMAAWTVGVFRNAQIESATQLLTQVITADIGAALTAFGFWLGSSWGSRKKDENAGT